MQARQGDILIQRIDQLPSGIQPVASDNGRLILAYGEATGHAHAVKTAPNVQLLAASSGPDRFLVIGTDGADQIASYRCRTASGDVIWIPTTHDPSAYVGAPVVEVEELIPGALVYHDEHYPFVLPPGIYRAARQREFTAEHIRMVAD